MAKRNFQDAHEILITASLLHALLFNFLKKKQKQKQLYIRKRPSGRRKEKHNLLARGKTKIIQKHKYCGVMI